VEPRSEYHFQQNPTETLKSGAVYYSLFRNGYAWRRFLAHGLDSVFSTTPLLALTKVVSLLGPVSALLSLAVALIGLVIYGPLCVSLFGTTLGKKLLGIYIYDLEGQRLSYRRSFARSWGAVYHGLGLYVPLVSIFTCSKSFETLRRGEKLSWDMGLDVRYEFLTKARRIYVICAYIILTCFRAALQSMTSSFG
jgi:hypothetical protein